MYLGVSNFQRAISIVIPRSRSALSLSSTHASHFISDLLASIGTDRCLTILEGTLSELSGFLLKLFDGTLVDTTALVDQVTSSGRFTGIDVTDDYDDFIGGGINDGRCYLPTTLTWVLSFPILMSFYVREMSMESQ